MIELQNVTKSLAQKAVLRDISLKAEKKQIWGLIGENGAGKTTLIKCITGIFKPDTGSVLIDGCSVNENPETKSKIGYVPDQIYSPPFYRVKDMVKFYSQIYSGFAQKRFDELSRIFSICHETPVNDLSKGKKTQLSFILALSYFPKYLILDEPTSGLDVVSRREVFKILLEEAEERETTIIISSHALSDLERLCDRFSLLKDGQIAYSDTLDGLKCRIKKLQAVFKDGLPGEISNQEGIIAMESIGRVHHLIVDRNYGDPVPILEANGALFVEELELSLEDILLYSIRGGGENEKHIPQTTAG
jgi:ABC-2 type transport system ATP-binding protein